MGYHGSRGWTLGTGENDNGRSRWAGPVTVDINRPRLHSCVIEAVSFRSQAEGWARGAPTPPGSLGCLATANAGSIDIRAGESGC